MTHTREISSVQQQLDFPRARYMVPRGPSLLERLGFRKPDREAHLARHYTQEDLEARGWDEELIAVVLGEPDSWDYPDGTPESSTQLYLISRAAKSERRDPRVMTRVHAVMLRDHREHIAALQQREAATAQILDGELEVEEMHRDELEQHAWGHFLDEWDERVGTEEPRASEAALMLASVHWLRFACTPYPAATQEIGEPLDEAARRRLNNICLKAIAASYPHLQDTVKAMLRG